MFISDIQVTLNMYFLLWQKNTSHCEDLYIITNVHPLQMVDTQNKVATDCLLDLVYP